MTVFNRPGISVSPVRPTRRMQGLARADVPVLLGYASRGPANAPVRIESLRQYLAIFGPPLPGTYLHDAVKGFFETGGRTAYVLRVVGPAARAATALCGEHWQVKAQTPLSALGPLDQFSDELPWFDHLRRTYGRSLPDTGAWANELSLILTAQTRQRLTATTDAATPNILFPGSLVGLTEKGLLRLNQDHDSVIVEVSRIDTARRQVVLTKPLEPPFINGHAVSIETITFDAEVLAQGQRVEFFTDLHVVADHPRAIAAVLTRQSLNLSLTFTGNDATDWADETRWPVPGRYDLSKGSADLAGVCMTTWLDAIEAQSKVDEIALVALPDLVQQPLRTLKDRAPAKMAPLNCDSPMAAPKAAVAGFVRDGATGLPINGCQVLAAGKGALAVTDETGFFYLGDLPLELIDLRLSAENYEDAETFLQSSTFAQRFASNVITPLPGDPDVADLAMMVIEGIRVFEADTVQTIQRKAVDLMGAYRVLVLDPPAPNMAPEALLNWRTQLGQSARMFAVAPWLALALDESGNLTAQPPSGHICGAFARAELAQGVHRAPANFALRHAKQLTDDFDEPTLTAFHSASLNPLRALPGQGLRLMGSRSLSGDYDWQQVSVRRVFDAIEKTLASRLAWAVFEPNSTTTRAILAFAVGQFLETLRMRGMFAGTTAEQAYAVVCDGSNNTPDSAARGELLIDIGIAPTRPYEFIRISLTAQADAIEVTEAT